MDFDSQRRDPRQQALMEALHGRLPQGVAVFDVDLRLVYANPRWSFFLEHATTVFRDPSPGTRFTDLLPGADDLSATALECVRTGETMHLPGWRACTHAGETFWDITLAPLIARQLVSGVICVVDDATTRVLAERAAAAKVRLAAFRADVSQALAGSDEIDAVLQSCAEIMVRHAPAAFARIWVLDEAEAIYRLRASAGLYTRLNGSYSRIPADWLRPEDRRFLASEPGVAVDLLRTHQVADPVWAAEQGLVSWAGHPLIARGHLVGFMVMFARQNFDEDTLSELAAIADAIAQFVQRKHAESALQEAHDRLEQRVAERTKELSLLLEISRNVASTLELQPLLELILDQLKSVADYTDTAVFTLEDDHLVIAGHRGPLSEGEARKTRYPVAQLAPIWDRLSRGEAIVIHDVRGESLEARVFRAVVGEALDGQLGFIRSCLLAPLVVKERLIGLMAITRGEPDVFEPGQIEMAAAIARQAAVAIENARLHEQERGTARELASLLEVSRNLASTLELERLLDVILDQVKVVADYDGAAIAIHEGGTSRLLRRRSPTELELDHEQFRGVSLARGGPIWEAIYRREAVIIDDVRGDDPLARSYRTSVAEPLESSHARYVRCWMSVPLALTDRVIGELVLAHGQPGYYTRYHAELVTAIAAQAAAAIENARLYGEAQKVAALEERQRLARELHDSVSQTLFGIRLTAQSARTLLGRDPTRAAAPLDYILSLAEGGIAETRALVFALRPDALATEGLVAALVRQVQALRTRYELDVEAALGAEPDVPLEVKEALYRIAQEALHNTVKHARATRVEVRLTCDPAALSLELADNGVGFDPTQDFPGHLGQTSMRERAEQLGGTLAVRSSPGQGTHIAARIPLPAVS